MWEPAAHTQCHLILWITQEGSYHDLFTDEEIKAQKGWDIIKGI